MRINHQKEARACGDKTYSLSHPCPKGHDAERRTSNNRCVECRKEDVKKYRASPAWNIANIRQKQRYKEKESSAQKIRARNILNNKLAGGYIQKQPCERCGATDRIHAHHDDYSKPPDVMWLCPKHHKDRHRELEKDPA